MLEQHPALETYDALHLPLPRLVELSFATPLTSLPMVTDEELCRACGTRIAFTNRLGGMSAAPYSSLNLNDSVGDVAGAVRSNRRLVLDCLETSIHFADLIVPKQVHGADVVVVEEVAAAQERAGQGADAVVCAKTDVPVLLTMADCLPLALVAPGGAFALVHVGWRGALAGIAGKALEALVEQVGCKPDECNAYIGPHIGSCCYEVDGELMGRFTAEFGPECDDGGKLSLKAAVIVSLMRAGAVPTRITDSGLCTSCNVERYFSYRAEGGVTGRQGVFACREVPA